jgi:putative ABC transport system ATP-binding protein
LDRIIEVIDIQKHFLMGDYVIRALNGVSFTVDTGEFIAIMGASGSGKSTLMYILGCLDRPTKGRYILKGRDVSDLDHNTLASIRNKTLGFVFQSFNLIPRLTAIENVELPLIYDSVPVRVRKALALDALKSVGLEGREMHYPTQLSGGQQQRVAIARAIVNKPSIILADEPTGNLDTETSEEILQLLKSLNLEGITIVMVTHEEYVAKHAKRTITLKDGKIIAESKRAASGFQAGAL